MKKSPKDLEELFDQYNEEELSRYYGEFTNMLKERILFTDLVFKDNPLLKMVKKEEKP